MQAATMTVAMVKVKRKSTMMLTLKSCVPISFVSKGATHGNEGMRNQ